MLYRVCSVFLERATATKMKNVDENWFLFISVPKHQRHCLFSLGTPVSSINKTDHHNITEILLKVVLNTIALFLIQKLHNARRSLAKNKNLLFVILLWYSVPFYQFDMHKYFLIIKLKLNVFCIFIIIILFFF
jgi:hypothetical protein